jgi:hemerythrin-like metal-binding protein
MDDQHGILMDTMNELRLAMMRGIVRDSVNEILERLVDFTRMHFASEERLLERFGYPDLQKHREHHARLLIKVQESAQRAQRSDAPKMRPLFEFLQVWYEEHFEIHDRNYGHWLNKRGVY